jgi:hypothetical protein
MRTISVSAAVTILSVSACVAASEPQNPNIAGVWSLVEVTAADGSVNATPQPSLYIFTDRHYSMARVTGTQPRPLMPDSATRSTITDAEMRSIFMTYVSNSGTYDLQGSQLVTRPSVALWPNFMSGEADTAEVHVTGDTLRVTQRAAAGASTRAVLVRQE